jgi:hypothetical protein
VKAICLPPCNGEAALAVAKPCERCGKLFGKSYRYSRKQWDAQRVCSKACYQVWRMEPVAARMERFSMPEPTTGCTLWLGDTKDGYGVLYESSKKRLRAHRVAYETARGSIPDGLELDHLCCNKLCVNPDHLEPVTHSENTKRYWRRSRANSS